MEEPSHRYAQPGQYVVSLTATANGCANTVRKNANQFAVPTANFSWEGECVSQPIMLKGANTIAIGKAGYEWVFEGSERRTSTEESYTWSTPGQKPVKLRAISEFNSQDSVSKTVTVVDAPVADFSFSDPCNLNDITFTFTGKTVGIPLYTWDFNGSPGNITQLDPPHVRTMRGLSAESGTAIALSECCKSIRNFRKIS
jgi:PKD repeat protein